jgi:hypothetical protein
MLCFVLCIKWLHYTCISEVVELPGVATFLGDLGIGTVLYNA